MVKITGFICVVLCGAGGGAIMAEKLRRLRESSRQLLEMLIQISIMIRYRALNVYEIVRELHSFGSYTELGFLGELPESYEAGEDFTVLWSKAVERDNGIGKEEKRILTSFGAELGTSDIEGQLMTIQSAIETMSSIESRRSEDYLKKGRLYRSIGALFGLMTGIILV